MPSSPRICALRPVRPVRLTQTLRVREELQPHQFSLILALVRRAVVWPLFVIADQGLDGGLR